MKLKNGLKCLNDAKPGTVQIIKSWKDALKVWHGERDVNEVAKKIGLVIDVYRAYLANNKPSFPESGKSDNRGILYRATGLECFSPDLSATRFEVSGIVSGQIPYGAEGWQTAIKEWIKQDYRHRGATAVARALGNVPVNTASSFLYKAASYPIKYREGLFKFTGLLHFINPEESYRNFQEGKNKLEQKVEDARSVVPEIVSAGGAIRDVGLNYSKISEMAEVYSLGIKELGKIVSGENSVSVAVKILFRDFKGSDEEQARTIAGLVYTLIEVSMHVRENPQVLEKAHCFVSPQDMGYLTSFVEAVGRGGDSLERWMQVSGYNPKGFRSNE